MDEGLHNGGGLPPKLDLRGSGVLSDGIGSINTPKVEQTAVQPAAPSVSAPVPVQPLVVPAPVAPAAVKPLMAKPLPLAPKPMAMKPMPTTVKPMSMKPMPAMVKPMPMKPMPTVVKPVAVETGNRLSQTMHVKLPDDDIAKPAPATRPQINSAVVNPIDPKRETSKIPLGSAKPMAVLTPSVDGESKTVRVQPVSPTMVMPTKPVATPVVVDEKRKTSRISLEAALAPQAEGASLAAPKTIKIKRPSEAPTVKAVVGDASKTAQLDIEADDEMGAGQTPTRRKTIKVKRPTQRPGVHGVTAATPAAVAGGAVAAASPAMAKPALGVAVAVPQPAMAGGPVLQPLMFTAEKLNPFWPITALLTVFVVIATIYMFCAQAFGPNISLTELSYGAKEMDLAWPGKIRIME